MMYEEDKVKEEGQFDHQWKEVKQKEGESPEMFPYHDQSLAKHLRKTKSYEMNVFSLRLVSLLLVIPTL